jgi:hypothetical protein
MRHQALWLIDLHVVVFVVQGALSNYAAGAAADGVQPPVHHSRPGDKDRAFAELDKAYEARSWYMAVMGVEAKLDNLRSDPRYDKLLAKVGLPH